MEPKRTYLIYYHVLYNRTAACIVWRCREETVWSTIHVSTRVSHNNLPRRLLLHREFWGR